MITRPRACIDARWPAPLSLLAAAALAATGLAPALAGAAPPGSNGNFSALPAFVVPGSIRSAHYDGMSDDLLTGGLGSAGLQSAVPPAVANPAAPSAAELRRLAIHTNYRAIVDTTANGGYGVLYGPTTTGLPNGGRVPGLEVLAYGDDGSSTRNVTLMVQVPDSFDPGRPCIVTATSSGSRGVYGAISTGEWGLLKGCAVAYTDKGTGSAPHDLQRDTVPLIDGTRAPSAVAGTSAHFRAALSPAELAAFNAASPHRFAFKHAHSQQNPERDWGRSTLQAIDFAFWVLNDRYSARTGFGATVRQIRPENTLVIASSVSNGGGAALAAAEADSTGLIDGVVVTEPQVVLPADLGVKVQRGNMPQPVIGRSLLDYTSFANVYGACAGLSPQLAGTPFQSSYAAFFGFFATGRCAALKAQGLLVGADTASQANEALAKLRAYGWEPESAVQIATFAAFEIPNAVAVTFANSLARASVKDKLCGFSFAATAPAGAPVLPLPLETLGTLAAVGNGVPPANGVQLVNDRAVGGPTRDLFSVTGAGFSMNLPGALCLRELLSGSSPAAAALQAGQDEVRRNGNLRGKPALVIHGRDDGLLPVNHTSRPYTALNKQVEGAASRLSYIEVTNAQHFDGFIGLPAVLPGFDSRYVPLHAYLFRGLDAMWAHLTAGTPLPPSQVVRTTPRGGVPGAAPAITVANVPALAAVPAAADAIRYDAGTLFVPE